ncbi:MAG: alanine racemase [Sphingomonadaceae bacterium]|nr:alanine racemase [Sphingomonadaceae bacterium]
MIPDLPPPTLRLRIDEAALASNWHTLDQMSGSAKAGAAVKADGYGLGVERVIPVLRKAGAEDFFVAHWCEVPAVLAHIPAAMLSVLHGPLTAKDARYARETGVRPVINSLHQARLWLESGGGRCDLMVDSGINRLGIATHEIADPLIARLEIDTLMSHLASADEDSPMNARQLAAFRQVVQHLPARRTSLANSAGIALGEDYAFGLTRPGLALYGGIPRPELEGVIRQVAFPQAAVLQLRNLNAGDSVGYNATFTASEPMRVAVVSLGYADGFLRCRGPDSALLHEGRELPILGKVSMDMIVVDCANAPDLRDGDWLNVAQHLPDSSRDSGLSQYELLTLTGRRFR